MSVENHNKEINEKKISSSISITRQMKRRLSRIAKSKGINLSALVCLMISESRYYKAE